MILLANTIGMIRLERNDTTRKRQNGSGKLLIRVCPKHGSTGTTFETRQGRERRQVRSLRVAAGDSCAGNSAVAADLQQLEADLGSNQVEQAKTKARKLESFVARAVVAKGCTGWAGDVDPIPTPPPPAVQRFCR